MIDLNKFCINDTKKIKEKKYQYQYTYNNLLIDEEIIKEYKKWPPYKKIMEECYLIKHYPDRHQIIQSEDINSCCRYLSFNPDKKNEILYVSVHFRSQNNLMEKYDKNFINKCIDNYLQSQYPYYNEVIIKVLVDEYLLITHDN